MYLAAAWRNLLSERNYLLSIISKWNFSIPKADTSSWVLFSSKSILSGFGQNTLFTKFSKCSNQERNFFNVCILDSFSGRFTQRYAKLLRKLFKRSEFIQTTEHFGEERADLPRKRPFALQWGRQCSAALWPADGGWSSGKNFAGRSRHNHRRPWESPASPTHLATESTR